MMTKTQHKCSYPYKRKILFLLHGNDFAGAQKRFLSFMEYADYNLIDVTLVSLKDRFPEDIKTKFNKIHFQEYNFSTLDTWIKWARFLLQFKVHSIIFMETWFTDFKLSAVIIAWLLTRGNVYMSEHSDIPAISSRKKWFGIFPGFDFSKFTWTSRSILSRRILTVSRGMKEKMVNYYNYPESKIEVAYFPLDTDRFAPRKNNDYEIRRKLKIPEKDFVIIVVARLVKEKGVDKAIEAFSTLLNTVKRDDIWLWILGDGYLRKDLEGLTERKGINQRVIFFGQKNNVEMFLRESDIFILSSEIEAFGVSLMEAMSVGLVCIATDTIGAREVLRDQGQIVDHSVESIFKVLHKIILMNPERINCIKKDARNYVLENYNKEKEAIKALRTLGIPRIS